MMVTGPPPAAPFTDPAPRPEVTAVVPVYRNAATVGELAQRLHLALAVTPSHELLFVDDGCPEGSLAVLRGLVEADRRAAVLALERNVGQQAAVLIGLAFSRSPWTVVLDADLQDPPEAIPRLLAAAGPATAAVFAGRRGAYESPVRLLTSRLFKTLLHLATGVPRDAGLYVALRRDAVRGLLELPTDRPHVAAMIGCLGLETASVPVERARRQVGRSAYSSRERLRSAFRAFGCVLDCRRTRPAAPPADAPWARPERIVRARYGARFATPGAAP
jgi:glycosyltransferase involved in cell wall biosynthesis